MFTGESEATKIIDNFVSGFESKPSVLVLNIIFKDLLNTSECFNKNLLNFRFPYNIA